ncbi:MAG: tripartite tricarboxylate transporter TctB family protein [Clostridia bacterium]|nr:tripartite tricarboxylate transporter TctB family protein [Clostridia bacterium]
MKDQTKNVNANEALMGLIVVIVGGIYLVLTLQIKDAAVGIPMEPKFFPLMISALLIILGMFFLFKTGLAHIKTSVENIKKALSKEPDIYKMIGITAINCIVYGLLFKRLGYVLSTVIFLEVMLFLTRGKKWIPNTIISVIFSVAVYFVFSKLLGVILPPMPFINI